MRVNMNAMVINHDLWREIGRFIPSLTVQLGECLLLGFTVRVNGKEKAV